MFDECNQGFTSTNNTGFAGDCVAPSNPVDWCVLQHPPTHTGCVNDSLTVYGRIYEGGIPTPNAVDVDQAVQLSVGVGPDGTDPVRLVGSGQR